MPWGDGTGPNGLGPMTGRRAGYCAGYNVPGYMNPIGGRYGWGRGYGYGRGYGFGRGRGWRWTAPYYAPPVSPYQPITKEQEAEFLKNEIKIIENELKLTKDRLAEIENEKDKK